MNRFHWSRRGAPTDDADRPLCFLHIAKTGGTSLTDAIARFYPPDRVVSDGGNLSVAYLAGLGDRLSGRLFVAGHPGSGVAPYLDGKADMITVLRRPDAQAVSNYLHVLSDPENPLHASARRRSLSDFLRTHPEQICYQYNALCVALGVGGAPIDRRDGHDAAAAARFLESLAFCGVIERAEACCQALSRLTPFDGALQLSHRNAALYRGVPSRLLRRLRAEYGALSGDPALASLFALEASLYATAAAILDRNLAGPLTAGSPNAGEGRAGFVGAWRFSAPRSGVGREAGREDLLCPLAGPAGHLVHGPHDCLPRGPHAVEFHLEVHAGQGPGRIELEVLSNGATCLRKRWLVPGAAISRADRTLAFINPDAANVLEFRIRAKGFRAGTLAFQGVTIRPASLAAAWPSAVRRHLQSWRRRRPFNAQIPPSAPA